MKELKLLYFPDKRLKLVAEPVAKADINDDLRKLMKEMLDLMYKSNGVGLAATQVNIQKRIIVADISNDRKEPLFIINPEIISFSGNMVYQEGCLSFPDIYAKVKRHENVTVKYLDEFCNEKEISAHGQLLSACLQHEIDHLDGITFYDHLSPLKQKLLREKIRRIKTKG